MAEVSVASSAEGKSEVCESGTVATGVAGAVSGDCAVPSGELAAGYSAFSSAELGAEDSETASSLWLSDSV